MHTRSFTITVIALSLTFYSCGSQSGQEESIQVSEKNSDPGTLFLSQKQFETMKMTWGSLARQEFSEELALQGAVKIPVEGMQEITPFYGGYVSGLSLIEGQEVRKGQVLFYLESPEFVKLQQDYLEAASQLDYLKAEYERQKTLFAEQISAEKNYLKANSDYQATLAKAAALRQQLKMIQINVDQLSPESIRSKVPVVSPINGFVQEVFVVPGAYLAASGKAMSLLNKEHLHIELIVFEKDASKMKVGQAVKINFPDQPGKVMDAEIHVIGQAIDAQRQLNVHADMVDKVAESSLVPGMYLEARVQLEPIEGFALPETAVGEENGKNYILVLVSEENGGFALKKVEVDTGEVQHGLVHVKPHSEIGPDQKILTKGIFNLL
ncbi:efflux RND transporter periplasmic adaptor subunit [Algoriphagus vanfongensis]|uniref:efflux RND transporter periplasmic adaptor subunit n=1 Tax=Algoriphagus vanfongensis TaxID=426371 RepID=UPI000411F085|nr:efflux RND transporter periplasmic adaptor subunit [Algoriphagus vanfongensis]